MIYCAIVLFRLVLFRRFTKQTRLVGSNKILIDLMSLNFIDYSVVIQIKDIIESNKFFHWRQINILWADISLIQLNFFSRCTRPQLRVPELIGYLSRFRISNLIGYATSLGYSIYPSNVYKSIKIDFFHHLELKSPN